MPPDIIKRRFLGGLARLPARYDLVYMKSRHFMSDNFSLRFYLFSETAVSGICHSDYQSFSFSWCLRAILISPSILLNKFIVLILFLCYTCYRFLSGLLRQSFFIVCKMTRRRFRRGIPCFPSSPAPRSSVTHKSASPDTRMYYGLHRK